MHFYFARGLVLKREGLGEEGLIEGMQAGAVVEVGEREAISKKVLYSFIYVVHS